VYDTARAALQALTDDELFERVAIKVLRTRFPDLRITGPSGDLNRDAFGRPLFGEHDKIVLLVSCEARWTVKLKRDLSEYTQYPGGARPARAIFVTNRSTKQTTQKDYKKWSRDELGIELEVVDLNELAVELESDALYRVAEFDLGVHPRVPRVLQPVVVFRERQEPLLPGAAAPLVGRDREIRALRDALARAHGSGSVRVAVVEGPAGVGKTRLAIDAAHATATTLVAAPGTAVRADSLADVPLDAPSIVVADDAHRSPDLSGLAALLADPRFDGVTILLTVAAGSTATVLARWGLDRARTETVTLAGLDRSEIDQIVAGHGFTGEAFRSHVAGIAQGSPWLAHTACLIAAKQGIFRWSDTAELLTQLVEQRLRQAGSGSDEHRAAAVALALLATAGEGKDLAALAGAVTLLPRDPARLEVLLEDLVQAGITSRPPYLISPAAAGPVLVAAALDPGARVKVRLGPALRALGRGAMPVPGGQPSPGDHGAMGIGPLPGADDDRAGVFDAGKLAGQLSVLAQAACQREVPGMLGMLQEAVLELLPGEADIATWLDVLTVAAPVAAAAPQLAGHLREALTRDWPPEAAASPWDDDPARRYRYDIETLLQRAIAVGKQASYGDVNRAVGWMLESAWLSEPVLGARSAGFAGQAVRALLRTRLRSAAQTWDDIFEGRRQVLDSVLRWGRDRCAGPPADLPAADREARAPAVAVLVLLRALAPLLTFVTEEHGFGTPGAARVFVWSNHVLPDDPRATAVLNSAAGAAGGLLDQLDPKSPTARPVLQAIVRLPREIRAEAARGLGSGQPLPAYAAAAMNEAASRISEAVASYWHMLPLTIRYAAAESTARPGGRRGRSLPDLAADGDPVASAAVTDTALEQLLSVLPIVQPRDRQAGTTDAGQEAGTRRSRAQTLAEKLSTSEAVDLLALIDPETASSQQYDSLALFARTAGRLATDPQSVLARLLEGTFPAAVPLFSGLLQAWPQECFEWLSANVSVREIAELALWIADELPADQEASLLDAITAQLAAARSAHAAEADTGHAGGVDSHGADGNYADELPPAVLTAKAADHLGRCRAQPTDRLARLVTLSGTAPDDALVRILGAVDRILSTPAGAQALDGENNSPLRRDLAGILARALTQDTDVFGADIDYDTAAAAEALGRAAPAETAEVLVDRTLAAALPVIPFRWEDLLTAEEQPEQREPLAATYQERILPRLDTLSDEAEASALDVLAVLGRDLPRWAALVRDWAGGDAADRARAGRAIRHRWQDPIWRELVPELLDAGLSEQAAAELRQGLLPINDAIDAEGFSKRLDALQPLLNDTRPVVRQFATETRQSLGALMSALKDWNEAAESAVAR
jgi:hypothetical protein